MHTLTLYVHIYIIYILYIVLMYILYSADDANRYDSSFFPHHFVSRLYSCLSTLALLALLVQRALASLARG